MAILDNLRPSPGLRVLVAAGAGGVGACIARAFHEAGARVHVCDVDRSALDRITSQQPGITGSMADASDTGDVDVVFDDVRGVLGGLDVLVGNAGIAGPAGPIDEIDAQAWERTVAVNLHSQFYFARRAVPLLRQSRAHPCLVAIASAAGRAHGTLRTPCVSSRWAIVGMTKSLAVELAPHGIRVNAVLPDALGEPAPDRMALRPAGAPEDVAALVLFLCSPAARSLTGQAIGVGVGFGVGTDDGGSVERL